MTDAPDAADGSWTSLTLWCPQELGTEIVELLSAAEFDNQTLGGASFHQRADGARAVVRSGPALTPHTREQRREFLATLSAAREGRVREALDAPLTAESLQGAEIVTEAGGGSAVFRFNIPMEVAGGVLDRATRLSVSPNELATELLAEALADEAGFEVARRVERSAESPEPQPE